MKSIVSRNPSTQTSKRVCSGAAVKIRDPRWRPDTERRTAERRSSRAPAKGKSIMMATPCDLLLSLGGAQQAPRASNESAPACVLGWPGLGRGLSRHRRIDEGVVGDLGLGQH